MNNPEKAVPKTSQVHNKTREPAPAKRKISAGTLTEKYKAYLLEKQRRPSSVFYFARHVKIGEKEFYDYFNSLEALERSIWKAYFEQTLSRLQADDTYAAYSVREKLLAFYFTWIEVLKEDRSYVVFVMKKGSFPKWTPGFIQEFKQEYLSYVNTLISEGKEKKEIAERYLVSDRYGDGLWIQLLFVLNFWVRDESRGFEDTDVAIEKAVNLSFDLMGKTPLDSVVDLAKFLYNKW